MLKKFILALILLAIAVPAASQSQFEKIHSDIIRKMDAERAQRSSVLRPLLAPQPTPGQLLYDVVHYTIDIAINPGARMVEGSVTARITPLAEMLDLVEIDADDVLAISSVRLAGGDTLEWTRSTGLIAIDIPEGVFPGDTIDIEVLYSGSPDLAVYQGFFFSNCTSDTIIHSLSEPWLARTWWPCKDYPDDKATFDLYFSVPVSLFAASNGIYLGYIDETRWSAPYRRYHWRENYPMATYLASIAAADYVRIDDYFVYAPGDTMPVTHYVSPSLVEKALIDLDTTVPALTFFSETFGLYPFIAEKYGVAICPMGGAMEHQTLTSMASLCVTGTHEYDYIFVHELSHMWFGDMITCKDWTHIWLNEGFASYLTTVYYEHVEGPERLRIDMDGRAWLYKYWDGPVLRDPDNMLPGYYFSAVVYDKGAWVLHMLRHIVGDETFFQILKDYCADPRYRFSVAETNDFKALCEARYGSPLSWFFDKWLTRTDRLGYQWSSTCSRLKEAFNLSIVVDQTQPAPYTMPVDFRITTVSGVIDTVFWVDKRHKEFNVTLADSVLSVDLDPDHWILCDRTKIVPTEEELLPVASLEQNYPNPFNPSTTIRFELNVPAAVSLRIYDVAGRLVRVLVEAPLSAGMHTRIWDGTDSRGTAVSSGVYLYRLEAGSFLRTGKMIMVR